MKRLRKGLLTDIIAEYLTPINMLLFITFLLMIAVIAWFINVWWTVEQQKLLLLKQTQQVISTP